MMEQIRNLIERFTNSENSTENNSAAPVPVRHGHGHHHHHHQPVASFRVTVEESENEAITIASDYLLQNNFPPSFAMRTVRRWIDQELPIFLAKSTITCSPEGRTEGNSLDRASTTKITDGASEIPTSDGVSSIEVSNDASPTAISDGSDEQTYVDSAELSKWALDSIRAYCRNLLCGDQLKKLLEPAVPEFPFQWTSHAARNSRRKMEDRHIVLPNVAWLYPNLKDSDGTAAFAVYDGHGGQECADYVRSQLFSHVFHSSAYPNDPLKALQDGFLATDARLLKYCEREGRQSGTTAVCAIIKDNNVYVAWAGDSRALIIGRDGVTRITDTLHDTKNKAELERVQEAGGLVFNFQGQDRVNGLLNITRSLGDLALKPTPLTAEPEVKKVPVSASDALLILASDGMFDGHDWDQINALVRDYLKQHIADEYPGLARHLVEASCNKTSDNVTVVVVFLKPMERLKELLR